MEALAWSDNRTLDILNNLSCLKTRFRLLRNKLSTAQQPEPRFKTVLVMQRIYFQNGVLAIILRCTSERIQNCKNCKNLMTSSIMLFNVNDYYLLDVTALIYFNVKKKLL